MSTSPDLPECRSNTFQGKWDRLDNLINGPLYANGQHWTQFPVLRRRLAHTNFQHPITDLDIHWIYSAPQDRSAVRDFTAYLHACTDNVHPSNSIQGETCAIIAYITRIIPFLYRASMDSNLGAVGDLLHVMQELLGLVQVLRDGEYEARDASNDTNDEEFLQLSICLEL